MSGIAALVRRDLGPLEPELAAGLGGAVTATLGVTPMQWQDPSVVLCVWGPEAVLVDDRLGVTTAIDGQRVEGVDERDSPDTARWAAGVRGHVTALRWDQRRQVLFVMRAPGGWRPMFWAATARHVACATDPAILLRVLNLPRDPNEGAIAEWFAGQFRTNHESIWKHVSVVPPGAGLTVSPAGTDVRHWHTPVVPDLSAMDEPTLVDEFRRVFDRAVDRACTDVGSPGVHLSGGLDSSSIAMRAVRLPERVSLPLVSVRFPGKPFDEAEWQTAVETVLGRPAVRLDGTAPYDWEEAAAWVRASGHLPLRPNVLLPLVTDTRTSHIRSIVTGEGGDDWLAGSPTAVALDLAAGRWRAAGRALVTDHLAHNWPRRLVRFLRHGVRPLLTEAGRARLRQPHLPRRNEVDALLSPEWVKATDLRDRIHPGATAWEQHWPIPGYWRFAFARKYVNWGPALAWADAQNLRLRHPFHDPDLVEFVLGLPAHMLWRDGRTKWILREAMAGTLPDVVRLRTTKGDMASLTADALRARLEQRPLQALEPVVRGWVSEVRLRRLTAPLLAPVQDRRARRGLTHLASVWAVIAVDLWLTETTS